MVFYHINRGVTRALVMGLGFDSRQPDLSVHRTRDKGRKKADSLEQQSQKYRPVEKLWLVK